MVRGLQHVLAPLSHGLDLSAQALGNAGHLRVGRVGAIRVNDLNERVDGQEDGRARHTIHAVHQHRVVSVPLLLLVEALALLDELQQVANVLGHLVESDARRLAGCHLASSSSAAAAAATLAVLVLQKDDRSHLLAGLAGVGHRADAPDRARRLSHAQQSHAQ